MVPTETMDEPVQLGNPETRERLVILVGPDRLGRQEQQV